MRPITAHRGRLMNAPPLARPSRYAASIASALVAAHTMVAVGQLTPAEVRELSAACDRGRGEACFATGSLYQRGDDVALNLIRAAEWFEKACSLNDEDGCRALAQAYYEGAGVTQDEARAASLLQRVVSLATNACERGSGQKCLELSLYYLEGAFPVERDTAKALELVLRGCDLQNEHACLLAAVGVSVGGGAPGDRQKAEELRAKGCALGDDTFRELEPQCRNDRR